MLRTEETTDEPVFITKEDSAFYPVEPAFASNPIAPSPTPVASSAPVPRPTVSPHQQLLSYGPTAPGASYGIVDGNRTLGHCYSVEKYSEFTSPSPMTGCVFQSMSLTYYRGGRNASYVDSGIEQETFATVFIDSIHSRTNGQADVCGLYGNCAGCVYLGNWLVELDNNSTSCAQDDDDTVVSASGSQIASFFFDYDPMSYEQHFFKLQDGRCT